MMSSSFHFLPVLHRVVEDVDVAASARQGAPDPDKEQIAAINNAQSIVGRAAVAQLEFWENVLVERRLHRRLDDAADVLGKLVVVCGEDDRLARIAAHRPGRKQHRGELGFAVPRRTRNHQPLDPAGLDLFQRRPDHPVVARHFVSRAVRVDPVIRVGAHVARERDQARARFEDLLLPFEKKEPTIGVVQS
jgi:hypothetical protein